MVEYEIPGLSAIPSLHKLPGYSFTTSLNSSPLRGVPNLYSVALWKNKIYLHFELDMATTGVENTVQSIINYLANNPMTFYYTV